jgi:hypothetical protein
VEPSLIAEAMQIALELSYNEFRSSPDFSLTDNWLRAAVEAKPYDRPGGADPEGFVTVGELHNKPWRRTGFVLVNPDTNGVKIAWSSDSGV